MSKKSDDTMEKMEISLKKMEISQRKTDYNETVPINRLPIEVFYMLLEYLDLGEMFQIESVCKKWNYFVKSFVGKKLMIAKTGKLKHRQWFFLDEPSALKSVMVKNQLEIEPITSSFLFNLKQLKISDPLCDEQDYDMLFGNMELLNRMVNLEVLEMSVIRKVGAGEQTIKLPNLKHLAVNHPYVELVIDCPKLVSFKTKDDGYLGDPVLDFLQPLSLTHLYFKEFFDFENIEKLQNLQYLSMSGFRVHGSVYRHNQEVEMAKEYGQTILARFPNLKEISLRPDSSSCYIARETFLQLLKERKTLGKDVAPTCFGIRIEAEDQLEHLPDDRGQSYGKFLYFLSGLYMNNHTKLCQKELKWTRHLSYSGLLNYSGNDKADVLSDRVPDEDQLIDFLNRLKRFQTLKIKKEAQLGVSFYQKLAATCLKPWLTIQVEPGKSITNFDFVFKFKNLIGFRTSGYDAGDDFVRRLFDHFKIFQFEHEVEQDWVKITKKSNFRFELSVLSGHCEVYSNLDELFVTVNQYCRGDYYEPHCHDCSCEFVYCYLDSYANNVRKEGFKP